MVRSWTDEKRYFRRAALPKFSTTGRWSDVGHYTPIIWHSTTAVGCVIAVSQSDEYLVCRYTTPGIVYGRDPLGRAEEHTSELQSLMRIPYAVLRSSNNNCHFTLFTYQHQTHLITALQPT